MIAKYVNPFTDFGFKKIFGEEGSKFLLMDFLNTLLPEENKISSLTLKNSENLPRTELERRAIFDIYCMNQKGERFIVELQNQINKLGKSTDTSGGGPLGALHRTWIDIKSAFT